MKTIIALSLVAYAGMASAQPRCVKWSWFSTGKIQKTVCLHWDKR